MPPSESLEDAMNRYIRVVSCPEQCSISFQRFSESNKPVMYTGPDSCGHCFGAPSLRKWIKTTLGHNSTATCPICRQQWTEFNGFADDSVNMEEIQAAVETADENEDGKYISEPEHRFQDDEDDEDDEDYDESDGSTDSPTSNTLEALPDKSMAADLVHSLYTNLGECSTEPSDDELKVYAERSLQASGLQASVPISDALWGDIRKKIQRMSTESKTLIWEYEIEERWIKRLQRKFKWRFGR